MKKSLLTLLLAITMSFSFSQQIINLTPSENIQDTIQNLEITGITQSVIINLAPGTYNQSIEINEAFPTTATNTLTIQSADVNNMATISTTTGNTIYIGASNIIITNLNIESEGEAAIYLDGGVQEPISDININNCNISGSQNDGNNLLYFQTVSSFNPSDNLIISNCSFNNGDAGVKFECDYNNPFDNLNINNCTFTNQKHYPIYISYVDDLTISMNTVNLPTNNPLSLWENSVGIYLSSITNSSGSVSIVKNNTIKNNGIDSVRYEGVKITSTYTDSLYIVNNFIDIDNTINDSIAIGINADYSQSKIFHNTIIVKGLKSTAINVSGSTESPEIRNNIFYSDNAAIQAQDYTSLQNVNYNCYYAGDSLPFTNGYSRYTLAQWQANNTNIDQNSIVENPEFTTGIYFSNTALDNVAEYITEVPTDITNTERHQPMCDMGAKELMFIDLGEDIQLCAGDTITITAPTANTYNWNTGATTQSITVWQLGNYAVTVTENVNGPSATDGVDVIQAPNSVITGTVSYSGGLFDIDDINMELYVQNQENAYYLEQVANNYTTSLSTFIFTDVEPNNYTLRGVAQNSNYNGVATSYYGNTVNWETATYLNVGCGDTLDLNFEMYEIPSLAGSYTFRGTVRYASNAKSTNLAGEPVTGAEIYIAQDPNNEPIADAVSDGDGNWEVDSLNEGSGYNIKVDIPGLNLISTYTGLNIASGDTVQNDFDFLVDTTSGGGISVDTATAILIVNNDEVELSVYPNPVSNFINISTELNNPTNINFTISDVSGKTVYISDKENNFTGIYNKSVNVSDFETGIYILNLRIGNTFYIKKIVKE